ncbi:MAG: hypothetical protein BWY65_01964 [Firmicutes bacterium ADurb.Bin373]|nr:MAG: hypothetical protein BWY65_01964 [Firmicutes bacterium ADurb.Bin373]
MGLTVCVTKDISLKKAAVPMLMSTAIPMVNRNNNGSIHEVVARRRMIRITGSRMAIAFRTSETAMSWVTAVLTASPAAALSSPIRP